MKLFCVYGCGLVSLWLSYFFVGSHMLESYLKYEALVIYIIKRNFFLNMDTMFWSWALFHVFIFHKRSCLGLLCRSCHFRQNKCIRINGVRGWIIVWLWLFLLRRRWRKKPKKNWMTLSEEMEGCVTDGGCERKEKHWERERKIKYLNNWIK